MDTILCVNSSAHSLKTWQRRGKMWKQQIHTCLYGSVEGQADEDGEFVLPDCTALGVSTVGTDQELDNVQMALLAGYGQHPVQELLTGIRTYQKHTKCGLVGGSGL